MFVALVWGVLDTYLVIHINDRWALAFGISSLIVLGAPIAEEITKALILPFLSLSRPVRLFWLQLRVQSPSTRWADGLG
jgi:hypothetical protein